MSFRGFKKNDHIPEILEWSIKSSFRRKYIQQLNERQRRRISYMLIAIATAEKVIYVQRINK